MTNSSAEGQRICAIFIDIDGTIQRGEDAWLQLTRQVCLLANKPEEALAAVKKHQEIFAQFGKDKDKNKAEAALVGLWQDLLGRPLHVNDIEYILSQIVETAQFQQGLLTLEALKAQFPQLIIGILSASFEEIALMIAEKTGFLYDPIDHINAASRFTYNDAGYATGFELIGNAWNESSNRWEKLKLELLLQALEELGIAIEEAALVDDTIGELIVKAGGVLVCFTDSPDSLKKIATFIIRDLSELPELLTNVDGGIRIGQRPS